MGDFNIYTTKPSYDDTGEDYYRPAVKTDFEANYVQIRETASRGRYSPFLLHWEKLPESEYQLIKTFFDLYRGSSFTWTHDITSVTYTVIFKSDYLKTKFVKPYGYRSLDIELEEM